MTWQPSPTVSVGGVDLTSVTVQSVSVRRGRQRVYEPTNAGYASIELLQSGSDRLSLQVGETVRVTVDDSAGNPQVVFTGELSDWSSRAVWFGGEPVVSFSLQAVGPLAQLNRRVVLFGGAPSEDDGARVLQALQAGFAGAWEEQPLDLTWNAVGTAVSWETFDGFDPSEVDPGVYLLAALGSADGGYSALRVAQDAAFSGQGVLYETADGGVGYADADRRPANAVAGFLEIPVSVVAADGLGFSSQLADVTNRVTVEYSGGAVTSDDTFSIVEFGVYGEQLTTELANLSNAQAVADEYILRHSSPRTSLDEVRINLANCGTALRDSLIAINTNDAVELSGLPSGLGMMQLQGFVEAVQWNVDPFRAELSLIVSDEALSSGAQRWGQVTATLEWQQVNATLQWQNARTVTT